MSRLTRSPDLGAYYVSTEYQLPMNCWCCGRFGRGQRRAGLRWCDRCGVRWRAPVTKRGSHYVTPKVALAKEQELRNNAARFYMRPGKPWSDAWDVYIDHADVPVSCPA